MSLSDNFSNNLSYLRKIHKSTLTEFADEAQISRSHLQNLLKSACNPRLDTVEHVARGLQIDPLKLLSLPKDADTAAPSLLTAQNMQEVKVHLQAALRILNAIQPEGSDQGEDEPSLK